MNRRARRTLSTGTAFAGAGGILAAGSSSLVVLLAGLALTLFGAGLIIGVGQATRPIERPRPLSLAELEEWRP